MKNKSYSYRLKIITNCYAFKLVFWLLALLVLTAFTDRPEPSLRIGSNNWLGYTPLYLARSLGHYKDSKVELVGMASASKVMKALKNGELEGAMLTLDEALTVIDAGVELNVVLIMDLSNGADALLTKAKYSDLTQLKGKKIAVEYTTVGFLLLDSALKKAKINISEIEVVHCDLDDHVSCYQDVDAIVTFEPVRTKLLNQGAKTLFDSSEVAGRIVDVLVVTSQIKEQAPKAIKKLLRGYFKALDYLQINPDDASAKIAKRLNLTPEQVIDSFKIIKLIDLSENHLLLMTDDGGLLSAANDLSELMLKKDFIKHSLNLDNLADNQFLPKK